MRYLRLCCFLFFTVPLRRTTVRACYMPSCSVNLSIHGSSVLHKSLVTQHFPGQPYWTGVKNKF